MLITLFSSGKKVGTDPYGNRYYEAKPRKGYKYTRRWVVYQGRLKRPRCRRSGTGGCITRRMPCPATMRPLSAGRGSSRISRI